MNFKSEYHFCGLTRSQCAYLFSCTEKTIRNWESKGAPPYAQRFLLLYQGRLDFFGKAWEGFRITPECLESPEGDHVYAGEVRGLKYLYQAANINRTDLCTRLDSHDLLRVKMSVHERPKSLTQLFPETEKHNLLVSK